MQIHLKFLFTVSILISGAIFGFFYAWICSTMWGLDNADPRVAIAAMQAMNASVRNAVFAPAFFGTPVVLALTSFALWFARYRIPSLLMLGGAALYLIFGLLLTMMVNVPMNEMLAQVDIPNSVAQAQILWDDYSARWQLWNQIRAGASGLALILVVMSLISVRTAIPR